MKGNNSYVKEHNPNSYNALDAGICMIVCLVVFWAIGEIFGAIVSPKLDDLENFDYYLYTFLSIIVSQGALIVIAIVFSKLRKVDLFSGGGFVCKFEAVPCLFGIVLAIGIALVFMTIHYQFVDDVYFTLYGISYYEYQLLMPEFNGTIELLLITTFILSPILPAICEEVVFRGIILRGARQFGIIFSIIFSGILFMLMHGNLEQVVLQLIGGIAICAVVTLTKNFALGIVMHFANNAFSNVYTFMSLILDAPYDALLILTGITFIIIGLVYFMKLALTNHEKKILNKEEKLTKNSLAVSKIGVSASGCIKYSNFKTIFAHNVDFSLYQNKKLNYFFTKNEKINKMNKYSNNLASAIVLGFAFLLAIVLIIIQYI